MKRAFFFALFGAFLTLASMQPALASLGGAVSVQNNTDTPAHVDIIYRTAFCKDDRFVLAARAKRTIKIGACMIKSLTAWIEDSKGKGHACRARDLALSTYYIALNNSTNPAIAYCDIPGMP